MPMDRRGFLRLSSAAALGKAVAGVAHGAAPPAAATAAASGSDKADYELRIGRSLVELAPDNIVSTKTYNGQFPGPLLRFKQGQSVTVDVYNDTETPEQLHWHGQFLPVDVDCAAEEGTPYIPAGGMRRLSFVPGPSGFHTHVVAGADLANGQYTGLVGPVYIDPRSEPGSAASRQCRHR
ncbi:Multicopper oxidase (plasmid) [Cupriavidus necator H850]|uniref:multicopper oxidase domain-containing protein n=1 Tax=Cupriavidus necator TaxID=106590 RepID=UPI001E5FD9FF|nr:Multicopper oxidase [Cupriavidus necator H850]